MQKQILVLILAIVACTSWGQTKENFNKDRHVKIESVKIAYYTQKLNLSPEESEDFWPIYNQYQKSKREVSKQLKYDRTEIGALSEAEAGDLIDKYLIINEQLLDLKRDFVNDLRQAIPIRKVILLIKHERDFKKELLKKMKKSRHNK